MYWQRDYQREVMNIFNHAWSDITDLDDLLYIQVPSYNYNARESVSVDMHFTVKLIKLFFFFFQFESYICWTFFSIAQRSNMITNHCIMFFIYIHTASFLWKYFEYFHFTLLYFKGNTVT